MRLLEVDIVPQSSEYTADNINRSIRMLLAAPKRVDVEQGRVDGVVKVEEVANTQPPEKLCLRARMGVVDKGTSLPPKAERRIDVIVPVKLEAKKLLRGACQSDVNISWCMVDREKWFVVMDQAREHTQVLKWEWKIRTPLVDESSIANKMGLGRFHTNRKDHSGPGHHANRTKATNSPITCHLLQLTADKRRELWARSGRMVMEDGGRRDRGVIVTPLKVASEGTHKLVNIDAVSKPR
jgi:hypothetical protein